MAQTRHPLMRWASESVGEDAAHPGADFRRCCSDLDSRIPRPDSESGSGYQPCTIFVRLRGCT